MRFIVFCFLMLVIVTGSVLAGELFMAPFTVKKGDIVELNYEYDDRFEPGEDLYAVLYIFDGNSANPIAQQVKLDFNPEENSYKAKHKIPDDAVFALIKIGNGFVFDTQNGLMWDFCVYNDKGYPVRNSKLMEGLSYSGNLPDNCLRDADFALFSKYLEEELAYYKDNTAAAVGLLTLRFDQRILDYETFDSEISKIISNKLNKNDELAVRAVVRSMRVINKTDDAQKLADEYIQKHPKSEMAEEHHLSALAKESTFAGFSDQAIQFLKNYPMSSSYERVLSILMSAYLQQEQFGEFVSILEKLSDVPATIYSQLAFALTESDKYLPALSKDARFAEAMKLMEKSMIEALQLKKNRKPAHFAEIEWNVSRQGMKAQIYLAYGQMYLSKNDDKNALDYLEKAYDILHEQSSPDLYENLAYLYIENGTDSLAYDICSDAVSATKTTDEILKMHKQLFLKLNSDADDTKYQNTLNSLLLDAKESRLDKLNYELINSNIDLGTIQAIDGTVIDLDFVKGKVIVLAFWSTWCGPCVESVGAVQELYSEFKDYENVIIAPVNIWEDAEGRMDAINEFLETTKYNIPVYLSKNDELPRKLSLTGLPYFVYIGTDGKLKFKDVGFPGQTMFLNIAQDKIDYILSTED